MDPISALKEILQQLNDLSGAGLDVLHKATGGGQNGEHQGGGKPPEGSPAEERSESPKEAAAEGDKPGVDGDAPKEGGQRPPFPPR
jgi:hypothetical protein